MDAVDEVACVVAHGDDPRGGLEPLMLDRDDVAVGSVPRAIVFEAVHMNEQWGSSAARDFDARRKGHPVVGVHEVVLASLDPTRGRHGVSSHLGKQVFAVVRPARRLLGKRKVRAGDVSMLQPGDFARRAGQGMQDLGRQDLCNGGFVKCACGDELPVRLLVEVGLQHRRHADHRRRPARPSLRLRRPRPRPRR